MEIPQSQSEITNPFSAEKSGFGVVTSNQLLSAYPEGTPMNSFHSVAHEYFKDLVLDPDFVCLGAQAAVKKNTYAFCAYPDMTDPTVAEGICHDIFKYVEHFNFNGIKEKGKPSFVSFIAAFKAPQIASQLERRIGILQNASQYA
ncbi:MAG: YqcI/YcgG family protein [Patescibacteria group bacterium]